MRFLFQVLDAVLQAADRRGDVAKKPLKESSYPLDVRPREPVVPGAFEPSSHVPHDSKRLFKMGVIEHGREPERIHQNGDGDSMWDRLVDQIGRTDRVVE